MVASNQLAVHENIDSLVKKHLTTPFRRPIAEHNIASYHRALSEVNRKKIIFDSGCGNGKSTLQIAKAHSDAFVIGIDKSQARLNKSNVYSKPDLDNYCLVRADLIDFLRLASRDRLKLYKHYILYPNPWPKKHHVKRRWHGSPVFRDILSLQGLIEIRSNWKLYLDEFAAALSIADFNSQSQTLQIADTNFLSDFESKYHISGQALWQLTANLNVDNKPQR